MFLRAPVAATDVPIAHMVSIIDFIPDLSLLVFTFICSISVSFLFIVILFMKNFIIIKLILKRAKGTIPLQYLVSTPKDFLNIFHFLILKLFLITIKLLDYVKFCNNYMSMLKKLFTSEREIILNGVSRYW